MARWLPCCFGGNGVYEEGNESAINAAAAQPGLGQQSDQQQQPATGSLNRKSVPAPVTVVQGTEEMTETSQLYCPICMCYYQEVFKTSCCGHHICGMCARQMVEHILQKHKETQTETVREPELDCPHCSTPSVNLVPILVSDPHRRYEDSPLPSRSLTTPELGGSAKSQGLSSSGRVRIPQPQPSPLKVGDSYEKLMKKMITYDQAGININRKHLSSGDSMGDFLGDGVASAPSSTVGTPSNSNSNSNSNNNGSYNTATHPGDFLSLSASLPRDMLIPPALPEDHTFDSHREGGAGGEEEEIAVQTSLLGGASQSDDVSPLRWEDAGDGGVEAEVLDGMDAEEGAEGAGVATEVAPVASGMAAREGGVGEGEADGELASSLPGSVMHSEGADSAQQPAQSPTTISVGVDAPIEGSVSVGEGAGGASQVVDEGGHTMEESNVVEAGGGGEQEVAGLPAGGEGAQGDSGGGDS